ncbi:MAG: DUF445 family protein [Acidimicrobiales bacterium]|nr:DUF445 family protein [Acidimicrobiales bacterium]
MKRAATGLLILAGLVFVLARLGEDGRPWLGYVRATAEAAMVGALADWFAVTAIFRHPLGLPIPHTAIVQKRKDDIGRTLGEFVRDNFMTQDNLAKLVKDEQMALRLGEALSDRQTARRITDEGSAIVRGLTDVLNDDTVRTGLEQAVFERIRATPVAPLAGHAIDWATAGGHHELLVDSTLIGLGRFLNENQLTFRSRLREESPWWVPEAIDDRVFDKIYEAVNRFIDEVGGNRDHELRRQLNLRTLDLAERLKTSPELELRGEELKEDFLANPEVRAWVGTLWDRIKESVIEGSHNPDSVFLEQVTEMIMEAGASVKSDPQLRNTIEGFLESAAGHIAAQGGDLAVNTIARTVESWNAEETTTLIEDRVGRDLQFIRINGTIVGGLAGLALYIISRFL